MSVSRDHAPTSDAVTSGQSPFAVRGGEVLWRGTPIERRHAAMTLEIFREQARYDRAAQSLATELEAAMRAAGYLKEEAAA